MFLQYNILWPKGRPLVFCSNRWKRQWASSPLRSACSPRVSKGPAKSHKRWGNSDQEPTVWEVAWRLCQEHGFWSQFKAQPYHLASGWTWAQFRCSINGKNYNSPGTTITSEGGPWLTEQRTLCLHVAIQLLLHGRQSVLSDRWLPGI